MCPQRLVTTNGPAVIIPVRLGEQSSLVRGGDFVLGEHGVIRIMGGHDPKLDALTGCLGPLRIEFERITKPPDEAMFRAYVRCHACGLNTNERTYLELSGGDLSEWRQKLLRCVYAAAVPGSSTILGANLIQGVNELHPCFNTRLGLPDQKDFDLHLAFLPGPGCQDLALEASLEIIFLLSEASRKHEQASKRALGF